MRNLKKKLDYSGILPYSILVESKNHLPEHEMTTYIDTQVKNGRPMTSGEEVAAIHEQIDVLKDETQALLEQYKANGGDDVGTDFEQDRAFYFPVDRIGKEIDGLRDRISWITGSWSWPASPATA